MSILKKTLGRPPIVQNAVVNWLTGLDRPVTCSEVYSKFKLNRCNGISMIKALAEKNRIVKYECRGVPMVVSIVRLKTGAQLRRQRLALARRHLDNEIDDLGGLRRLVQN
jgi:hypothetical protein